MKLKNNTFFMFNIRCEAVKAVEAIKSVEAVEAVVVGFLGSSCKQ